MIRVYSGRYSDMEICVNVISSVFGHADFITIALLISLQDDGLFTDGGDLLADLEDALAKQRNHMTGAEMAEARKKRIESHIQSRVTQLEGCTPWIIFYIMLFSL